MLEEGPTSRRRWIRWSMQKCNQEHAHEVAHKAANELAAARWEGLHEPSAAAPGGDPRFARLSYSGEAWSRTGAR
ncbi:hypothetical protein E2562_006249 [Oryza meyeriana var. granulata]|uniref:Uncharacterized protein n=1 Tax=Oryza meyeriana var. granulata TaxID=110450 RepID=A0A6G1CMU6_9ORYZ|nr:hypothetical protein E2562_006249 [Oryza meyeriana var. granulata]